VEFKINSADGKFFYPDPFDKNVVGFRKDNGILKLYRKNSNFWFVLNQLIHTSFPSLCRCLNIV
jgi:hypothetical protein